MKWAIWAGAMAAVLVFLTVFVSPWLGLIGGTAVILADSRHVFDS